MDLIERSSSREVKLTKNINPYADGSVLVEFGNTKVHVTASVETSVPKWLKGQDKGWVTAEYSMLPMATHDRSRRERKGISGRSQEIQRLIGRSLRSVVDLTCLKDVSITVDCDVLVADGGTRTASVTGGFVALSLACQNLLEKGTIAKNPIMEKLAAVSVGINKQGRIIADLNYEEDSSCETDMNIVMTESGKFVEVQGTAEGEPFSKEQLSALLSCAEECLKPIFSKQEALLS